MKKQIVILIGCLPQPIVYKRVELAKELGDVHLICWDRCNSMLLPPVEDGYSAHVIKIQAKNNPLKRLIPYHKFCMEAGRMLKDIQPDLIHVQGLDMLKIACSYKKHASKPVRIIYEVADLHRLLVDRQKSPVARAAQKYLRFMDRHLEQEYDLLILTSMKYYDVYFHNFVVKEKVLYMPNVPDLSAFASYRKKKDGQFTIGYIGGIRYKKEIKLLLDAAKINNVHLMFAGFENEPLEIEPICKADSNIEWVGRFDFNKQAATLYGKCDVMYSVYDADMHNVRVALPNKLYEAVYCEMPLIVAKNTYLAQVVEEWGVGVAVDHKSVDELAAALKELRENKALREQIAENCRKHKDEVDLQKYNAQLKNKMIQILGQTD
jgi:succinoglycan biosynthesis protein ExoL